jgi:RNA 3'-terminal phosphate cyclase (ATP)
VSRVSRHLCSNAELLGYFLPVSVELEGAIGQPGRVRVQGVAAPSR